MTTSSATPALPSPTPVPSPTPTNLPAIVGANAGEKNPWSRPLWIVWAIFLLLGSIGMAQRLIDGHLPAGYGSYVPWGLWIAIYFHAVGIAGGAFVVGGLGYIFNIRGFSHPAMLRTIVAISLAAFAPGLMAVWLDLGHMDRAFRIMTSPNFTSMMAFNAWMYQAFMAVAAVVWLLSFRNKSEWLKPLVSLGVFFAILIPSQSGAFFGVVDSRPFWHNPLFPIMFLASAVTSGAAIVLFVRATLGREVFGRATDNPAADHDAAIDRLRIVVMAGMAVYFVLEFAEFSVALWNPAAHSREIGLILSGPYWWVFWIIHLLIGGIVPFAILGLSKRRHLWAIAAALIAVTFISTRLNVLIPGQAVPEIKGLQDAFFHPRLDPIYHATLMEYLVGLFLVAVGMAAFVVLRQMGLLVANRIAQKG